jgi:hypothetical protein
VDKDESEGLRANSRNSVNLNKQTKVALNFAKISSFNYHPTPVFFEFGNVNENGSNSKLSLKAHYNYITPNFGN